MPDFIRADQLEVGHTFFLKDDQWALKPTRYVVTGVGQSLSTYKGGFLWRKVKTRRQVQVALDRVIMEPIGVCPILTRPVTMSFAPSEGMWVQYD